MASPKQLEHTNHLCRKKNEEKFRKKIQKHFKHTSVWHRSRIFIAEFSDKNEYKIEFVKGCCHLKPSLTSSCTLFFSPNSGFCLYTLTRMCLFEQYELSLRVLAILSFVYLSRHFNAIWCGAV